MIFWYLIKLKVIIFARWVDKFYVFERNIFVFIRLSNFQILVKAVVYAFAHFGVPVAFMKKCCKHFTKNSKFGLKSKTKGRNKAKATPSTRNKVAKTMEIPQIKASTNLYERQYLIKNKTAKNVKK